MISRTVIFDDLEHIPGIRWLARLAAGPRARLVEAARCWIVSQMSHSNSINVRDGSGTLWDAPEWILYF